VDTAEKLNLLIRKTGVTLNLLNNGEYVGSFKAFLQPLRYKNKIYLRGVATELGYDSLKKYLLISPYDVDLYSVDGTYLTLKYEKNFLSIDHSEKVFFGNKPLYTWSIVTKEG